MQKILILTADPRQNLSLSREVSDLTTAIQRLGKFELRYGFQVTDDSLQGLLAEHSPQIVHFCGHGAGEKGLVFLDKDGREKIVSTEILTRLFKTFSDEINCTVLNACDSIFQAEAIVEHISYVVGMSQPVLDKAAHLFSIGFYKGLAADKTIEQSYEMGCIAIQLWSEPHYSPTYLRKYRKVEFVGDLPQSIQPSLAEYMKPVLLKKHALVSSHSSVCEVLPLGSGNLSLNLDADKEGALLNQAVNCEEYSTKNSLEANRQHSSIPSALPLDFIESIHQEIECKEYKDHVRDAYDNFGQQLTQIADPLAKTELEQRRIFLDKVNRFWIEGFLKSSLRDFTAIPIERQVWRTAAANSSQRIESLSIKLDESYEQLRDTKIYDEIGCGRTLLILGDPGSGKTIALLQLAQRLIKRSKQNPSFSLPVLFNLSSWAKRQQPIVEWLIDELGEKYQVSPVLSKRWLVQQQLILLLDGLDEVNQDCRNDCVLALNDFINRFPQVEVAVCSRIKDYEALTERLKISSALCLQPFSSAQIHGFLESAEGSLTGLKSLLKENLELEKFAQTPLILNLMIVAYQGWSVEKLSSQLCSGSDYYQHLFDAYALVS